MPIEIRQWHDIKEQFTDSLLLGNGASIAVDGRFNYSSLFAAARDAGSLTQPVQEIFARFSNSTDFEYVLRKLWQAKLVNEALGVEAGAVEEAYAQVRLALIKTVQATHVTRDEVLGQLTPIYQFMKRFKTVLSLNYDLIVYWAAMLGNNELDGNHRFKDGLIGGVLDDDWPRLRQPLRANQTVTMFFYPHGNLALVRTPSQLERKVHANDGATLLEGIIAEWQRDDVIPIFVSEGTSPQKRDAIRSSSYLSDIYFNAVTDIGDSLVIYGWRMGEQEQHILDQIKRAAPARVAVSVYTGEELHMQIAQNIEQQLNQLGIQNIVFFDSRSAGSWNNPVAEEVVADVV
ncbi:MULTISPECIES: DUF4917 family protein [Deefgea]|uniref:DUF4917 family protein n=1 Tax=Deefgea chitinilytica TaxID=570276 RepID=A0ABS2CAF3_9NEIS|nr:MULTISPECIES: DUF4917 family protein [Deefgea]MBM5571115.1 DUF4917 family protein [Deefgea chitinilytica]MBM9888345.1 DUF4917 family protein [Deefgea sp. CFH1-16]